MKTAESSIRVTISIWKGVYFPNYDFLRSLRAELETDKGTVFRYSNHENAFLNHIYRQLSEEKSPSDNRQELMEFIKSISHSTGSTPDMWKGQRDMMDLWALVKRYYYDPSTNGKKFYQAGITCYSPIFIVSSAEVRCPDLWGYRWYS